MEFNPKTWAELKDFCNQLSEEQLKSKVTLWREEDTIINEIDARILETNYYVDDFEPDELQDQEEAERNIRHNPEGYPDGLGSFELIYKEGEPVLFC